MSLSLSRCWRNYVRSPQSTPQLRYLRSDTALEAIARAADERTPVVALYNYPSLSGALSALFAHLFHSHINLSCLVLPFSSVVPFRVEDLCFEGLKTCYFLDFIGPKEFAAELSQKTASKIICFDHRKSALSKAKLLQSKDFHGKLTFHIDLRKSSSRSVYDYFSSKCKYVSSNDENSAANRLVDIKNQDCVELLLNYLDDHNLHQWRLPDIKAFNVGVSEWRSKLNCITNPHMYEQLLEMSTEELITRGNSCILHRKDAAKEFLEKAFVLRLGRGLYGECLGVRADSNPNLNDEIGKELSIRSASAGLRSIGAVIFMQRRNLKMCLRSTDGSTDTSEIAKAYGGGGLPHSSSFIIRMDEYNQWLTVNSSS